MSKMSQLHMELSESASDLGFSSIEEAEQAGYRADYNLGRMVYDATKELNEAHEAWLKERDMLCHELEMLISDTPYKIYEETLTKAVKFLREECHD